MKTQLAVLAIFFAFVFCGRVIHVRAILADDKRIGVTPDLEGYKVYERSPKSVLGCSIVAVNFRDDDSSRSVQLGLSVGVNGDRRLTTEISGFRVKEGHVVWLSGWPHRVVKIHSHPTDRSQRWVELKYDVLRNPESEYPLSGIVLPLDADCLLGVRDFIILHNPDKKGASLVVKQWPSELRPQDAGDKLETTTAKPGESIQIGIVSVLVKCIIPSTEARLGGPWVQLILSESQDD